MCQSMLRDENKRALSYIAENFGLLSLDGPQAAALICVDRVLSFFSLRAFVPCIVC
jgi:hypothetical protein